MTRVKTSRELDAMRESGRMLEHVLTTLCKAAEPGKNGTDMSALAKQELHALGGEPAFLGYQGFSDVVCVSINEAVVHGIPNNTPFRSGDVVTFDFGVRWAGMITDAARTVVVGGVSSRSVRRLLDGTQAGLNAGIQTLHAGVQVGDISHAIEVVLRRHKLGIIRDLVGHGVGHSLHEDPNIPNYGPPGKGPRLQAGMTIAIEPMATLGSERVYVDKDGWTVRTHDHSLAAQFEDTILITDTGFEILTRVTD